ncbi:MAG: FHA domain-containing protein [Coleofasciculus sp. S288]|nr:FHA domain-containing protein [Coleofasciculus sp. S288]
MIVCPNCNHQNPEGATQCEACYTPLPATTACPNCGATIQTDASFCGQCGFNLKASAPTGIGSTSAPNAFPDVPDLIPPDPLIVPDPVSVSSQLPDAEENPTVPPEPTSASVIPATIVSQPDNVPEESTAPPTPSINQPQVASTNPPPPPIASAGNAKTQLQVPSAHLLHVQTNMQIELPQNLSVVHIGKLNDQIPPDIDVSGFPNSEIVSRIHADIRVEGDAYYIEDVGSSNGTYINHTPLASGNRHRLRTGDRISLGKGDKVTFLFHGS